MTGATDSRAHGAMPASPRPFVLRRYLDVSGFSGTGDVAEGVQWSDGTVSMRGPGTDLPVTFWPDGVGSVEAVHGYGGATEVVFLVPESAESPVAREGGRAGMRSVHPQRLGRR